MHYLFPSIISQNLRAAFMLNVTIGFTASTTECIQRAPLPEYCCAISPTRAFLPYFHHYFSTISQKALDFYKTRCYNIMALWEIARYFPVSSAQKSHISGCGAVGSALPWGGRGRKFKSCHSDQKGEIRKSLPFSFAHFHIRFFTQSSINISVISDKI